MFKNKFDKETELEICEKYLNGLSCDSLGQIYNCGGNTIRNILKRNHYKVKTVSEGKRIYSLDQNYFDVIDTEDKDYFLGWLFADGNVGGRNIITLGLQERDKSILELFRKYLKTNKPLWLKKPQPIRIKGGSIYLNKAGKEVMALNIGCN